MPETEGPSANEMGLNQTPELNIQEEINKDPEIKATNSLLNEAKNAEKLESNIPSLDEAAENAIKKESTPKSAINTFFTEIRKKIKNYFFPEKDYPHFLTLKPFEKKRLIFAGLAGLAIATGPFPLFLLGIYFFSKTASQIALEASAKYLAQKKQKI